MNQLYKIVLLVFSALAAIKANAQVTVDATGGSIFASYTTLKNAINHINDGTHQGSIDIRIHGSTVETSAIILDSNGKGGVTSYTSVTIRPADTATVVKTIALSLAGAVLFELNGSDHISMDGRPLGTGNNRLLELKHNNPNGSANSTVLKLTNGVSDAQLLYTNFTSLTTLTGNRSVNVLIGPSASGDGNKNILLSNCVLTGGIVGLDIRGNVANFIDDIHITKNRIINAQSAGIIASGLKTLYIDSNEVFHTTATSGWAVNGILLNADVSGAHFVVTRNHVFSLQSLNASALFGVIYTPGLNAPDSVPELVFINNNIALTEPNNPVIAVTGFQFQGQGNPGIVTACNNTFRIGGIHTVSNSNPSTVGVNKMNNSQGSSFVFRNNLCINTRTGTGSQHIGYWNATPGQGVNISDYNTIWGSGVFVGAWNNLFIIDESSLRSTAFPNEQHSTVGDLHFINASSPDIGTGNNTRQLLGTPLPEVPDDIYGTPRHAVSPFRGAFEHASGLDTNEVAVTFIYTYGKIPIGTIDSARAIIRNNGLKDLTGLVVTLSGTASGYSGSVTIDLEKFKDTTIFLSTYIPSVLGIDTLTVSVPSDQNNTNNEFTWVRENTLNALSYASVVFPQEGNLGTLPQGEMMAKFSTPVPNFVNQVNVNFTNAEFDGPWPFQIVIYEDSGSVSGPKQVPLWISSVQQTINGIYNLSLPSVPVSGHFYIGVRQTTASSIGFAFQNEDPIRTNTFYFRQGIGFQTLPWNDFAVFSGNQFRFMIEPRLKINDDLGVTDVSEPNGGCAGSTSSNISVLVQNLGLFSQSFGSANLTVAGTITDPDSVVTTFPPAVVTSGFLVSDDTLSVLLATGYDMSAPGDYVITAWLESSIDNNRINDTLPPLTRTVLPVLSVPAYQSFDAGLSLPAGWSTNRFSVNGSTGSSGTNSLRAQLFNSTPTTTTASVSSPRIPVVTGTTELRFDYKMIKVNGGAPVVPGNTDSMNVYLSVDCGLSYIKVATITGATHIPTDYFTPVAIPLAAFAGNDIRVKIQLDWTGTTNNAFVDIDNIRFIDTQHDIAAKAITGICVAFPLGTTVIPQGVLNNAGAVNELNIPVGFIITGPSGYTASGMIPALNSGSSDTVSFIPFTPAIPGIFRVKLFSSLTGDDDPLNDTAYYSFTVANTNLFSNAGRYVNFNKFFYGTIKNTAGVNHDGNNITIEAWINRGNDKLAKMIVSKDSSFFIQYSLGLDGANYLSFNLHTSSGPLTVTSTGVDSVPPEWTHVAATYDGNVMTIYINGKVAGTQVHSGTIVPQQSFLYVGQKADASQRFSGGIDELKIWNTTRSAMDIRDHMHTRMDIFSSTGGLQGYYQFDEAGTDIADISGNCNIISFTGTPVSATAFYPLGKPVISNNIIAGAGAYTFGNTNMDLVYYTISGVDTVHVHKFSGMPIGTSPLTVPGGISAVHPEYWIAYRYGDGNSIHADMIYTLGKGNILSGASNTDFALFSRNSGTSGSWILQEPSATGINFGMQSVTFNGQNDSFFSKQLMIGGNNNPLPVKLLSFKAEERQQAVVLLWSTASEIHSEVFEIERAYDREQQLQYWNTIGAIKAAGTSNEIKNYQFTDHTPIAGSAYYRLKMLDKNGAVAYSDIRSIDRHHTSGVQQVHLYPNPFNKELFLQVASNSDSDIKLVCRDLAGKVLSSNTYEITKGINELRLLPLYSITPGVYFLSLEMNGERYVQKLVKQ